jgi:3-oxoacyl-[acyl-carrier protein] reductase
VISLGLGLPDWQHPRLGGYRVDLTDPVATVNVAAEIAAAHEVKAVVHIAGMIPPNRLEDARPEDVLTLALLPGLRRCGAGQVLYVCGGSSLTGLSS